MDQQEPISKGQSHRLRRGRRSTPNARYHLRFATHRRIPAFADFFAARAVVLCLREKQHQRHAKTLAYVVMPDHVHWLCELGERVVLALLAGHVKGRVSARLRRSGGVPCPLWQDGFFDRQLRPEEDPHAVARYIVANPLRRGLVTDLGDYPHWDAAWMGGD
ncbi:MAG: transposase [Gammaproteobacteria bacterium]|nr:MAG: transposase [Gammaproteobacteria bacterium]